MAKSGVSGKSMTNECGILRISVFRVFALVGLKWLGVKDAK